MVVTQKHFKKLKLYTNKSYSFLPLKEALWRHHFTSIPKGTWRWVGSIHAHLIPCLLYSKGLEILLNSSTPLVRHLSVLLVHPALPFSSTQMRKHLWNTLQKILYLGISKQVERWHGRGLGSNSATCQLCDLDVI